MLYIIEMIVLGALQGITEFLPVSSSGHLLLFEKLNIGRESLFFNVIIHLATLIVAMTYYRKEIVRRIKKPFIGSNIFLAVTTITTLVVVFLIKTFFINLLDGKYLSFSFMITAFILTIADYFKEMKKDKKGMSLPAALFCGFMQGIAIIPGISRSGATICALIIMKIDIKEATTYSFIASIPIIILASLYEVSFELKDFFISKEEIIGLLGAFVIAVIAGYIAIRCFISRINKKGLKVFIIYVAVISIISMFLI